MIRYRETERGWVADCDVRVGIDRRAIGVELGPLPDEPDPGGLRATPVVALPAALVPLARAGALRAGGTPTVFLVPAGAPRLGGQFLVAVAEGVEVIFVEDGGAGALTVARALGGRPVAAASAAGVAALQGLQVDVQVAIPSEEGDARRALREALAPFELERLHHLVEVDARPAFEEAGTAIGCASPEERAAAAAGVLAGRIAAGNRRWRAGG
jgi:hypothetical protein